MFALSNLCMNRDLEFYSYKGNCRNLCMNGDLEFKVKTYVDFFYS